MSSVEVPLARGEVLAALAAEPRAPGPGVLVVHARGASDERVPRLVERLADAGFAVLAPDLAARAAALGVSVADLPDRRVQAELETALAWLSARPGGPRRLGVLGLAGGGTQAFLLACTSRHLACAVAGDPRLVYTGLSREKPIQPLELALNLGCPILLDFSGWDPAIQDEHVARVARTLDQFGKTATVQSQRAAELDVLLGPGPRYDDAVAFLRSHLEASLT